MKSFPQHTSFRKKSTFKKVGLSLLLALTTVVLALPGQALEFPQTGDRGAPERTSGGGTRGDRCAADIDNSIQALIPKNNVSTFAEPQAKLWLYVPAELTTYTAEVFVKHPDTHEIVYEQQTALPKLERDGLIELTLPAASADGAPLLADNQDYFWEFAIICDVNDRTRDRFIQGFLHKVADDTALQARLEEAASKVDPEPASPSELAIEMYAGAALWQEALSLALSLAIDTNSAQQHYWGELLDSVGLSALNTPNYPVGRFMQRRSLPSVAQ